MKSFRELSDLEMAALPDEELFAYALLARDSGRPDVFVRALQILADGYHDIVKLRVARKVPAHEVEDVTDAALIRVFGQAAREKTFAGRSIGEFRKWMHTIVNRQIADVTDARAKAPGTRPLPEEHEGEEDLWGAAALVGDETGAVGVREAIDRVLGDLSEEHRLAVELYVFEDRPAGEVAADCGLTENNVHQIAARFRARMREELDT